MSQKKFIGFNQDDFINKLNEIIKFKYVDPSGTCSALCDLYMYYIIVHESKGKDNKYNNFIDYLNSKLDPKNEYKIENVAKIVNYFQDYANAGYDGLLPHVQNFTKNSDENEFYSSILKIIGDNTYFNIGFKKHSIFIGKNNEGYMLFDPNIGVYYDMTLDELKTILQQQVNTYELDNNTICCENSNYRMEKYLNSELNIVELFEDEGSLKWLFSETDVKLKETKRYVRELIPTIAKDNKSYKDNQRIQKFKLINNQNLLNKEFLYQNSKDAKTQQLVKNALQKEKDYVIKKTNDFLIEEAKFEELKLIKVLSDIKENKVEKLDLTEFKTKENILEIFKALASSNTIQITMNQNQITLENVDILISLLNTNQNIKLEVKNINSVTTNESQDFSTSDLLQLKLLYQLQSNQLKSLNVNQFKFFFEATTMLAEAIRTSTSLTEISFDGCNFDQLTIQQLTEAITVNKTITKVHLTFTGVTDENLDAVKTMLETNKHITDLNISGNLTESGYAKLLDIQKNMKQIDGLYYVNIKDAALTNEVLDLAKETKVKALDLSCSNIDDKAFDKLIELVNSNHLTKLHLEFVQFSDVQKEQFLKALCTNTSIKDLNIKNTIMGKTEQLLIENKSITTLWISNFTVISANDLKQNTAITEIICSQTPEIQVTQILERNKEFANIMETLKTDGIQVTEDKAFITKNRVTNINIHKLLIYNSNLQKLVAKDSAFTLRAITMLTEAIRTSTSLTEISFEGCNFDQLTIQQLTEAITVNKTITKVHLTFTGITDENLDAVKTMLETNKHITDLNISGNLTESGYAKLLDIQKNMKQIDGLYYVNIKDAALINEVLDLAKETKVKALDLSCSNIDDKAFDKLIELVNGNHLTKLNLEFVQFSDVQKEQFLKALCTNTSIKDLNIKNTIMGETEQLLIENKSITTLCISNFSVISANDLKQNTAITEIICSQTPKIEVTQILERNKEFAKTQNAEVPTPNVQNALAKNVITQAKNVV